MKYSLSAWLRAGILLFGAAIPLAAGALLWRAAERAAASERELVLQHTAESAQAALRAEADRLAARVGGAVARAELVVAAGGTGAGLDSLLRATRDEILPRPSDGALAVFDPRGLPVAVTSPALGLLGPPPRGLIRQAIETGSATDCLEESGRPVLALAASLRRGGEVTGVLVLTHLIEAAGVGARAQVKVLWAGRALPEADSLESRISMGLRHAGAEASRAPRVRFRVSAPGPAGYEVLALPAFPGATGAVPYVAAALPHSPLGAAGSLPAAAAALLVLGACGVAGLLAIRPRGSAAKPAAAPARASRGPLLDPHDASWQRQILQQARESIVVLDEGMRVLYANPYAAEVSGFSVEELSGLDVMSRLDPRDRSTAEEVARAALHGLTSETRFSWRVKGGEYREFELTVTPVLVGGRGAVLVLSRDVSERQKSQEELETRGRQLDALRRLSERLISSLDRDAVLEAALDDIVLSLPYRYGAIYAQERPGGEFVVRASRRFDAPPTLTGSRLPVDHPYVRRLATLTAPTAFPVEEHPIPQARELLKAANQRNVLAIPLRAHGEMVGFFHLAIPGDSVDEVHVRYLRLAADVVAFALRNSILYAELTRNAAELGHQRETLDQIFAAAAQGLIYISRDGSEIRLNPEAERLLAIQGGEVAGPADVLSRVRIVRADGSPASLGEAPWIRALATGHAERQVPLALERPDGAVAHVQVSATPVRDPQRETVGVVAALTDLTERQALEERLRQAQKMEAVGRLAGGVAHDFNNLLTVICGYSQGFLETLEPGTREHHDVGEVLAAAERAVALTRQLLTFSRRQVIHPRPLDLNALVGSLTGMLTRLVRENVRIHTRLEEGAWPVMADHNMIEQLLVNLVLNGRDAIRGAGDLVIETANVGVDEAGLARQPEGRPGRHVMLAVSDTGGGIDPRELDHIFEPFYTTKDPGEGTGLGLSTVHGIVQQHGGWIRVNTDPGHWTTFRVFLPATLEAPAAPAPEPVSGSGAHGTETILLVEDEGALRDLSAQVLRGAGYQVFAEADGPAALARAAEWTVAPQLLLTDVVLPGGMSGVDVARELTPRFPGMQVLYTSGFNEELAGQDYVMPGDTPFLQKPYMPRDLLARVRAVLDARAETPAGSGGS